jgi:predicted GNAT family N-acyltransferase
MRQVAVDTAIQQQGIGKKLIAFAEKFAKENSVTHIECNARETAVPFYQKMKYEVVGAPFLEVGIPHFFMQKELY